AGRHGLNRGVERLAVLQQRRDVLERDPGLGEIFHRADLRPKIHQFWPPYTSIILAGSPSSNISASGVVETGERAARGELCADLLAAPVARARLEGKASALRRAEPPCGVQQPDLPEDRQAALVPQPVPRPGNLAQAPRQGRRARLPCLQEPVEV